MPNRFVAHRSHTNERSNTNIKHEETDHSCLDDTSRAVRELDAEAHCHGSTAVVSSEPFLRDSITSIAKEESEKFIGDPENMPRIKAEDAILDLSTSSSPPLSKSPNSTPRGTKRRRDSGDLSDIFTSQKKQKGSNTSNSRSVSSRLTPRSTSVSPNYERNDPQICQSKKSTPLGSPPLECHNYVPSSGTVVSEVVISPQLTESNDLQDSPSHELSASEGVRAGGVMSGPEQGLHVSNDIKIELNITPPPSLSVVNSFSNLTSSSSPSYYSSSHSSLSPSLPSSFPPPPPPSLSLPSPIPSPIPSPPSSRSPSPPSSLSPSPPSSRSPSPAPEYPDDPPGDDDLEHIKKCATENKQKGKRGDIKLHPTKQQAYVIVEEGFINTNSSVHTLLACICNIRPENPEFIKNIKALKDYLENRNELELVCKDADMVSQNDFHGDTDWKVTVAKMISGVENIYAIKTVTDFHLMVSHVSLWLKVKR